MSRPEYVTCTLTGLCVQLANGEPLLRRGEPVPQRKTWCDRVPDAFEFCFVDASHAALNARNKDRLLNCPGCAKAIAETLLGHVEDA